MKNQYILMEKEQENFTSWDFKGEDTKIYSQYSYISSYDDTTNSKKIDLSLL